MGYATAAGSCAALAPRLDQAARERGHGSPSRLRKLVVEVIGLQNDSCLARVALIDDHDVFGRRSVRPSCRD